MLVEFLLFFQIGSRGCAAFNTYNDSVEDISQLSRSPERCPNLIAWPQVPAPISCDDPGCRGSSSRTPPYRCNEQGGIMYGIEVFGCACCPRLIDCQDPNCAGTSSEEICRSALLKDCVCVSSNRRASLVITPETAEDAIAGLSLHGAVDVDTGATTMAFGDRNCPREPPVACLDQQCRGSDD